MFYSYWRPWFDLQLDALNSCLFTYNTFIKLLYMFQALPCSSSGGPRHNCKCAVSVIVTPAGDCLVHRLRKDSHLQRVTIPETAHILFRHGPPDDEQGLMLETCRGI